MKIALLNPRYLVWSPNIWAPLGLTYIAAVLEKAGHKVKIIDMNAFKITDKELLRKVKGSDIIGIGGMITEYKKIVALANIIKDNFSDIPVILGGPCTTTLHEKVLEKTKAEYAVIGEGEISVVKLVNSIERGLPVKKVKGIVYRSQGKSIMTKPQPQIKNLDSLPFPARHLLDMEIYNYDYFKSIGINIDDYKKIRNASIITSRGCPYRCTFCDKGIWGYNWRPRSPKNIIDEITLLKQKYKINCVWLNDDTFVIDRKRVEIFSKMMEDLDVIWNCYGRVNLMQSKDMFMKMRKGNCRVIGFGFESGDQKMLNNSIKKGTTLDQARNSVKYAKQAGIKIGGFFILGMPGETKRTINKTFRFARELDLDYYAFSVATAYPGTELYNRVLKEGIIRKDQYLNSLYGSDWIADVIVSLTRYLTIEELKEYQNKAFKEFVIKKQFGKHYYLHPQFLKKTFKIISSMRNIEEAKKLGGKIKSMVKIE